MIANPYNAEDLAAAKEAGRMNDLALLCIAWEIPTAKWRVLKDGKSHFSSVRRSEGIGSLGYFLFMGFDLEVTVLRPPDRRPIRGYELPEDGFRWRSKSKPHWHGVGSTGEYAETGFDKSDLQWCRFGDAQGRPEDDVWNEFYVETPQPALVITAKGNR